MTSKEVYSKYSINGSHCYNCHVLFSPSHQGPLHSCFVYGKIEPEEVPWGLCAARTRSETLDFQPSVFLFSPTLIFGSALGTAGLSYMCEADSDPSSACSLFSVLLPLLVGSEGGPLAIRTVPPSHW